MKIPACATDESMTDVSLLSAWRRGDMRAARTLYRRHFDAICRFFRNKLSDLEEVADLVGETFLELLKTRSRDSWDDERVESLRHYLYGIAKNVLYRYFRQNYALRQKMIIQDCELEQRSLDELAPRSMSSIIGGRRELDVLIKALRGLPLQDQILLEAKYFEYFSDAELAGLLGLPQSTVPGRLRGARSRLLAKVEQYRAEGPQFCPDDPGAAMDVWIAELRVLIVRTNPTPGSDDDGV